MNAGKALTSEETQLLNQVSTGTLMTYTANIAKEVCLSGSAEEEHAFRYVKEQLDIWAGPLCCPILTLTLAFRKMPL